MSCTVLCSLARAVGPNTALMKPLFLLLLLGTLVGCTTGSSTRSSSTVYPAVSVAHVEVLTQRPSRSFIEIGVVTGWTNAMATPESAIRRMREKAAALGADAILVTNIDKAFYTNTQATAIRWK